VIFKVGDVNGSNPGNSDLHGLFDEDHEDKAYYQ